MRLQRRKGKTEAKSRQTGEYKGAAKEVPFERCYEESGMIEVKKGCFTHGYEIAAPMKPKEMTYSAKKVRAGMRKVFALFGDMSFQFVMRNHLIDTGEYLKRIQVQEGRYKQGNGADSRIGVQGGGIGRWIGMYNRLLEENADVGHNNYESRMYLTVTMECGYAAEVAERFGELDGKVADAFKELYGYAWISAMFFSALFRILMKQGEERMKREGLGGPQLKVPVRCLIDECKNVGRIPNLEGVLSFCRKYRISIVPIFQSFSQLEELYGKGPANEFLSNCDTMMFLGGRDPATLKIICEEMGKRTVKVLSYSNSKGRGSSASVSKQQTGAELMTRVQLSQLSNQECMVFIRGLRPFKDEKYRLEEHPNYRYLAEGSLGKALADPFVIAYDDEELERCRLKAVGEDGYVEPKIVDSARRRALIERNRRKVTELEQQVDSLRVKLAEAVAKKKGTDRIEAGIERNMRRIERLGRILPERGGFGEGASGSMDEAGNGMAGVQRIKEMKFIGSFAPGFEFDEASGEDVKRIFEG